MSTQKILFISCEVRQVAKSHKSQHVVTITSTESFSLMLSPLLNLDPSTFTSRENSHFVKYVNELKYKGIAKIKIVWYCKENIK